MTFANNSAQDEEPLEWRPGAPPESLSTDKALLHRQPARSEQLNLLLISKREDTVSLLTGLLRESHTPPFDVIHTKEAGEASNELSQKCFDAVILDAAHDADAIHKGLGGLSSAASKAALVVVSDIESLGLAVAATEAGAQDYILRGEINATSLRLRILCAIQRERRMEDARTGSANAEAECARLKRLIEQLPVGVMHVTERHKLDQQKDEFIALASHELRTPVTSIKGFAQLAQRTADAAGDKRLAHALTNIEQQSDRLARLVNELLDVSRVQNGSLPFHPRRFELCEVVENVTGSIELITPGFTFNLDITPSHLFVNADRHRIEEVVTNLLDNAVKYSNGSHTVKISAAASGDEALVAVHDEGMGIPAGQHAMVFERFYRATNAGANARSGFGLGLFIAREIINRHGGRIWFESSEGKGSTFYFTVPLDHSELL
ncbi:MAG: hypothetical protein IVW55_04750 [Chloroflexi bacterium]|nr:hypothetical protein [Chloroflexota bacterium]